MRKVFKDMKNWFDVLTLKQKVQLICMTSASGLLSAWELIATFC